jgi:hypothetical protein
MKTSLNETVFKITAVIPVFLMGIASKKPVFWHCGLPDFWGGFSVFRVSLCVFLGK